MTDIQELERRVTALEAAQNETAKTQTWMASTLGRIAAVQDGHTKTLDDHTARLDRMAAEDAAFRRDLPGMIAETMREVLKETKGGA